MSWFNFFQTKTQELMHPFGRGINAKLADNEDELYNNSSEAFERKDILTAYEYFFKTLQNYTNNEFNNNVTCSKTNDKLEFVIYQGSAKITGTVSKKNFYAEVILTKKENTHVSLKRYILERNYQLTYTNYSTDNEYIKLKLYHDNITMNPQKIFYPLRELALNADFDKEYMRSEFSDIVLQDIAHLTPLDENELQIKYNYLQKWILEIENKISALPANDNAGMQAFILLNILLKTDYLIVPQYEICQKISKKIQLYFSEEGVSVEAKNDQLKRYIQKLKKLDFEEFKTKFYNTKYTFNPVEKTSQEEVALFIDESLIKIRWYKNNRYNQIIPTLYRYIAFYILYNYGVNPVIRSLLHTLVEVHHPEYLAELGYERMYDIQNEVFAKKTIIAKIQNAIEPYQDRYKLLEPFGEELNFTSLNEFSNSFYLQLNNLNFEEI